MTTKEALYQLIDQLSEQDLEHAASYLAFLHARTQEATASLDTVELMLRDLPVDDETTTEEEDADERGSWEEYQRGGAVSRETAWLRLIGETR